ncbi:MAG: acyltransferase [Promethearchaeota archaeon]
MFQPASLKGDSPTPIDERIRKKYLFLYLIIIILSFIPCSIYEYAYYILLWNEVFIGIFFFLLPLNMMLLIYILQLSAILFSFLILKIINLIHKPREGVFRRDPHDKDYFFWNLRNIVKKWPLFIAATNPFPWLKNRFTLRFFGVKIGKKCLCDGSWISSEFVTIGKNCIIGISSTILTFGIEAENFILKKIIIENNVALGAKCILLPGTIIKKNAKLSAYSSTKYDDILDENLVYKGIPVKLKEEKND